MKYVTYEGDTFRDTFLKHLEILLLAIYEFNENRAQKTEYHEGMGERSRTWKNAKCELWAKQSPVRAETKCKSIVTGGELLKNKL